MDPGGIQRHVAIDDSQEPGGLDIGRLTDARHLLQFVSIAERTVLTSLFVDSSGRELIESGDIAQ
jgi:hypothetical protein